MFKGLRTTLAAIAALSATAKTEGICFNTAAFKAGYRKCPCRCGGKQPMLREDEVRAEGSIWHSHTPYLIRFVGDADRAWDTFKGSLGFGEAATTA